MKPDDDDFRIGVPGIGLAPPLGGLTPPARRDKEDDTPPELRPGETELGRPPQVPSDLAPLTTADFAAASQRSFVRFASSLSPFTRSCRFSRSRT